MTSRIAVVGAGLAGLTAANHLADAGVDVTVLERAREPGGRATTTTHGQYRFNQGPHAFYVGGEGQAILSELGIEPAGHTPIQGKAQALLAGELHRLPIGPASLAATDLLGVREKIRFGSFLARVGKLDPDDAVGSTVSEWVAGITPDPMGVELLLAVLRLTTYANAPDVACAGAAMRQLQLGIDPGVLYLDGGWGRLVAALRDRAADRGADFVHGRVTAAAQLLDDFDSVVLAAGGPAVADDLLGGANVAGLVDRAGPPVEAAVLELGVTTVPKTRFVLGIDEPVYASVHAPPAELAPPGHAVVCLARYLAPGENHDAVATRRDLQALAARLGVDEADVAEQRYLHRMTVAHGMPLAAQGGWVGRPGVDAAGDSRIALAGDWVGSAGLLADASIASGREAALSLVGSEVSV